MLRVAARVAARLAVVAIAASAVASSDAGAESIWARVAGGPAERAYQTAMVRGDGYAQQAAELSLEAFQQGRARFGANDRRGEIQANALRAAEAYEAAATARPTSGEPHFRAGLVLYAHFVAQSDRPPAAPTRRAIEHWTAFERLAPRDPRMSDIYLQRSLAYTKLGGDDNFRLAVADYERELAMVDAGSVPADGLATIEANAAEMLMGIGELDRAITLYRAALELNDIPLHGYGLAVALDRDGQAVKARELMRNYVDLDRPPEGESGPMSALRADTVFFVPEGEVDYYFALGHEVLGQYDTAANFYRTFLRLVPTSRWAERARANLAVCEKRRNKPVVRPRRGDPVSPLDQGHPTPRSGKRRP